MSDIWRLPKGAFLKPEVDLIPAHLPRNHSRTLFPAAIDFSSCTGGEIDELLRRKVISLPIVVRTLVALKQNGVVTVHAQYRPEQENLRQALEHHPVVGGLTKWYRLESSAGFARDFVAALEENGGYWINPFYLLNGVFLEAFEEKFDPCEANLTQPICNDVSGKNLYWLPRRFWQNLNAADAKGMIGQIEAANPQSFILDHAEVEGQELREKKDRKRAEKILCRDVTRKKGGYLAKRINEPISLWIAKLCAHTPVRPNFLTLLNSILGVLSAYWVYLGGLKGSYAYLAAGAVLFYAVDIFDGIDGELARLTFRLSKHGALYDTISDNITLLAFLIACTYAAYRQMGHWVAIVLGVLTVFLTFALIAYLYYFTMKYFGNASLRLYEARFMPMIPRENGFIRIIQSVRHLYTKDVLAAGLSMTLLLNLPAMVVILAPLFPIAMFIGFAYMGLKYSHLLVGQKTAVAAASK